MSKQKTKQNGITLIALVITIIVLLILAGVSISMVVGDNGVIEKTKEAKLKMERATVIELARTDVYDKQVDNLSGKIKKSDLIDVLNTYFYNVSEIEGSSNIIEEIVKTKPEYGNYDIQVSEIYRNGFLDQVADDPTTPEPVYEEFAYTVQHSSYNFDGYMTYYLKAESNKTQSPNLKQHDTVTDTCKVGETKTITVCCDLLGYQCTSCKKPAVLLDPEVVALKSDSGVNITGDNRTIKDGRFSLTTKYNDNPKYGADCDTLALKFEYTGQRAGTITLTTDLYFEYNYSGETGNCPFCSHYLSTPSNYQKYSAPMTFTINVTE